MATAVIGLAVGGRDADPRTTGPPGSREGRLRADPRPRGRSRGGRRRGSRSKCAPGTSRRDPSRRMPTAARRSPATPRRRGLPGRPARAGRHGLGAAGDWEPNRPAGTEADPIVMKLLPLDHRVEGSVVDQPGQPISGVEIEVASLPHPIDGHIHVGVERPGPLLAPAVTDQAGRFAMKLPRRRRPVSRPRIRGISARASAPQADARTLDPLVLEPAGADRRER